MKKEMEDFMKNEMEALMEDGERKKSSILLKLLSVWILFYIASSHSCFRFLLNYDK